MKPKTGPDRQDKLGSHPSPPCSPKRHPLGLHAPHHIHHRRSHGILAPASHVRDNPPCCATSYTVRGLGGRSMLDINIRHWCCFLPLRGAGVLFISSCCWFASRALASTNQTFARVHHDIRRSLTRPPPRCTTPTSPAPSSHISSRGSTCSRSRDK
ncbi:hypothetical protein N658DRAFT_119581 [Parathielavia hyrcaniae]|uniref:Uncharacterized protein n=1 Tax=Parathielavia hyrcaniae TaxID=113614 RepID=A0AAN6Q882_9PEZI|nr:hypothetical protein N658DRAFT_119581 [Parathielavia hyrcaniae]